MDGIIVHDAQQRDPERQGHAVNESEGEIHGRDPGQDRARQGKEAESKHRDRSVADEEKRGDEQRRAQGQPPHIVLDGLLHFNGNDAGSRHHQMNGSGTGGTSGDPSEGRSDLSLESFLGLRIKTGRLRLRHEQRAPQAR